MAISRNNELFNIGCRTKLPVYCLWYANKLYIFFLNLNQENPQTLQSHSALSELREIQIDLDKNRLKIG